MTNWSETVIPYWKKGRIINETVLCIKDENGIGGNLQYSPKKVLSVKDYGLERVYIEGVDFKTEKNRIVLPERSSIPYLTEENTRGIDIPPPYIEVKGMPNGDNEYVRVSENVFWTEGSLVYGHQICVTYFYDDKDADISLFGEYGAVCPKLLKRIKTGLPVSLIMLGDSVGEVCSASAKFSHPPYQPWFFRLFADGLREFTGIEVIEANFSVGGKTSAWGAEEEQIENCSRAKPNLLLLHFGINDCWNVTANEFGRNIEKIYSGVKKDNPEAEILFLKAARTNPSCYEEKVFRDFWAEADKLENKYEDFYTMDMFSWSLELLRTKKYMDITGNGINHPNDYLTRLYAMQLLNAFVEEAQFPVEK